MKKLYAFLVLAFTVVAGNAQIVTIPDANFKAKLLSADTTNQIAKDLSDNYFKIDANNDGEIQESEASQVSYLSIFQSNIHDIYGLEYFLNLKTLICSHNRFSQFYVYPLVNLEYVDCSYNIYTYTEMVTDLTYLTNLKYLNLFGSIIQTNFSVGTNTALEYLNLGFTNRTSIDISHNLNLITFECSGNINITTLDTSHNLNLTNLYCKENVLTSLNLSNNINLKRLHCNNNNLANLDISSNLNLIELDCSYNLLTSLDLTNHVNLGYIVIQHNQISSIDLHSQNLYMLEVSYNPISSLNLQNCIFNNTGLSGYGFTIGAGNCNLNSIIFPQNQDLIFENLNLSSTLLQTLELPNSIIYGLFIENCATLTNLNLKNVSNFNNFENINDSLNIYGTNNLLYVCVKDEVIDVVQNVLGYSCNVNSYCSFNPGGTYYTIQGNNTYDENNNGCDILDIHVLNLKYNITDNTNNGSLISDTSGNYSIPVSAGTHTITPELENPTYFVISPTTVTVTFPTTASPFTQNFCVTPNGIKNDVEATIIATNPALPGFDATYRIVYKNKGNQISNGTVNLTFDDTKMDLVSALPTNTSSATNSLSWSFSNLQPFETREILVVMNVNSPTETPAVNGGDVLNYTANIIGLTDEMPIDNTSVLNQTVVNSFDPNDKTCIEGTTVSPSTVGQYVHYVVRFENTGTANAQNIVVRDMIDTAKYDVSSLVPLSGSASYVTRITNTNQVEFIFQNINLPFVSGSNDGYVAFKIKTKPTLVDGDTFSNSANIYFDYNAPIVTNSYSTNVYNPLATPDFEFSSVFSLSPVPAKNVLTITTKQAVVMSSISIYNMLGQLVQVNTNPNETIDVSGLKTGSYFIKIVSDKGTASGKFLKE